jgi:phage baseplate assembly protein gpV
MSMVQGVVVGLVTQVRADGQVKVHFPWLDEEHETDWVRIATLMAGKDRGSFFMPEVEDEVLVAFGTGTRASLSSSASCGTASTRHRGTTCAIVCSSRRMAIRSASWIPRP